MFSLCSQEVATAHALHPCSENPRKSKALSRPNWLKLKRLDTPALPHSALLPNYSRVDRLGLLCITHPSTLHIRQLYESVNFTHPSTLNIHQLWRHPSTLSKSPGSPNWYEQTDRDRTGEWICQLSRRSTYERSCQLSRLSTYELNRQLSRLSTYEWICQLTLRTEMKWMAALTSPTTWCQDYLIQDVF